MKALLKFQHPQTKIWHVCQSLEEVKSILEPFLLTAKDVITHIGYENVFGVHPDELWEKLKGGDYDHGLRVCAEIHFKCLEKIQNAEIHFDDRHSSLID